MLGLDPDYYRINAIDWAGEPYEKNGIPMRNADGIGSKYVRDVNAVYSGTVTLPHQEGAAWKSVYTEELTKKNSAVYTYEANALTSPQRSRPSGKNLAGLITAAYEAVIRAITEHPILAAIQFVLLAAIITGSSQNAGNSASSIESRNACIRGTANTVRITSHSSRNPRTTRSQTDNFFRVFKTERYTY